MVTPIGSHTDTHIHPHTVTYTNTNTHTHVCAQTLTARTSPEEKHSWTFAAVHTWLGLENEG